MTPTSGTPRFTIRHARPADIPAIRAMQQRAMWVLALGTGRLSLNNGSEFACVRMMKRFAAADRLAS